MEDSVEIVIEKLLHVTKDIIPKVIFLSILKLLFACFYPSKIAPSSLRRLFRYQMMQSIA